MAGPSTQPSTNVDAQFTIKTIENTTSNHEINGGKNPGQVPFSLSIKGVPFLRDRDTAYKVEK